VKAVLKNIQIINGNPTSLLCHFMTADLRNAGSSLVLQGTKLPSILIAIPWKSQDACF